MSGVGLFAVAARFLRTPDGETVETLDADALESEGEAEICLTTFEGEEICYTVRNRTEERLIAGADGTFIGIGLDWPRRAQRLLPAPTPTLTSSSRTVSGNGAG